MMLLVPLFINLLAGLLFWLHSVKIRNVSMVDSLWGLMFWMAALYWFFTGPDPSLKATVLLLMVTVWSWRLSIHLARRNYGEPEDHRYTTIRQNNEPGFWWKSSYLIFGLQAALAWVASLSIYGALQVGATSQWHWLDSVGLLLWLVGMKFEVVADHQLAQFRRNAKPGEVLSTGLWRYSRHPNYFGECCLWWGIYLFALSAGAWWSIISPLLMTFLLLKVSGVVMMESTICKRRPAYQDYIERTSAFFPWFPRRSSGKDSASTGTEG